MPALAPEYELVLMLDPEAPDERRDAIVADARQRIESNGAIKHDTAWGMRKMAFEIRRRTEADYRFFRFESGGSPLLDELNHNLKIADGVLRFRIFKVDPRSPVVVPPPPTPLSAGRPERGDRGSRRDGPSRGRGGGPPRSPGADDDPVAAPVEPVETPAPEAAPEAAAAEAAPSEATASAVEAPTPTADASEASPSERPVAPAAETPSTPEAAEPAAEIPSAPEAPVAPAAEPEAPAPEAPAPAEETPAEPVPAEETPGADDEQQS